MRHAFPHPKKIAKTRGKDLDEYRATFRDGRTGQREKATVLCEVCNTRWLSQVENRVRPKLLPWMSGVHGPLSVADQQLIAFWATKTALMAQFAYEPASRVIPKRYYRALHGARDHPPDGMYVWIGTTPNRFPGIEYRQRDITETLTNMKVAAAFQADLIVHRLLVRVSGVDPPEVLADIEMFGLVRIWPSAPLLLHDPTSEARGRERRSAVWVPG
jgi:hypothetical protein